MFPRRLTSLGFLVAAFSLSGTSRLGAELAASSPFLPPPGQVAAAAPTAGAALEFRGVSQIGQTTSFSIFDPSKKTGTWVGLNESGYDFAIKKYDEDSDTVTVEHQGRTLTLVRRTPKIASIGNAVAPLPMAAPLPVAPVAGAAATPPNPLTRNVVANPTPATEAARLADWQAEIQRRRDARAQGVSQPTAPTPPPAVAPAQVQPARPTQPTSQQNQQQRGQRGGAGGQRARN